MRLKGMVTHQTKSGKQDDDHDHDDPIRDAHRALAHDGEQQQLRPSRDPFYISVDAIQKTLT